MEENTINIISASKQDTEKLDYIINEIVKEYYNQPKCPSEFMQVYGVNGLSFTDYARVYREVYLNISRVKGRFDNYHCNVKTDGAVTKIGEIAEYNNYEELMSRPNKNGAVTIVGEL